MEYEKFTKKCGDKASVWHYFLRAKDSQSAKCSLCQKILKCHGGTTTGLRTHLKSSHSIDIQSMLQLTSIESNQSTTSQPSTSQIPAPSKRQSSTASQSQEPPAKKSKLTDYFQSNHSLEATVSRMVALDGLPFSIFCTSEDQRRLFLNSGYALPKTPKSIKNIVVNYSKQEKKKLVAELNELKSSNIKFSLSFDEWTSTRNARYININIHYGKEFADGSPFKNVGLARITGSMPAETCINVLRKKLAEFELSLEDVIAVVTDGAAVMLKVGRSLNAHHQVCLAHGIQLAVLDVIYKKNTVEPVEQSRDFDSEPEEIIDTTDLSDVDTSDEEEDGGLEFVTIYSSPLPTINTNYKTVIEKVRAAVKIFKNSPVKNDMYLQKHVRQDMGKELQLLADCKTRWGSIATMVERFNLIKSSVSKALIDMKSQIEFSQNDLDTLDSIQKSLNIVKVTVEALCRRDATLLTADVAMKFMLRKLDGQNTALANELAVSLRKRISQRRLLIASILQYLQNPETYFTEVSTEVFPKINNTEMVEEIYALTNHFQHESCSEGVESTNTSATSASGDGDNTDFAKELNKVLEKSVKDIPTTSAHGTSENEDDADDKRKLIRIEMALFENGGNRGFYLSKAYNYLLTIPPTSVESERAFSSAAYTCNKIRSSLKDDTLDAICFLRSLFQQIRSRSRQMTS